MPYNLNAKIEEQLLSTYKTTINHIKEYTLNVFLFTMAVAFPSYKVFILAQKQN